ncbi:MAG: VOC family protein [Candidatus Marinimicrobia bacterium]|nr:VOC family protein [Candidatus Neomarinimicrobiota bacterium]
MYCCPKFRKVVRSGYPPLHQIILQFRKNSAYYIKNNSAYTLYEYFRTDFKINTSVNILNFEKIDLASKNPGKLAQFYNQVFGVVFKEITYFNLVHYSGIIGGIELFLCPLEPAGVSRDAEGIQQFHIEVDGNLESMISTANKLGYTVEKADFDNNREQACFRDPDGNPWIVSVK